MKARVLIIVVDVFDDDNDGLVRRVISAPAIIIIFSRRKNITINPTPRF